MLNDDFVSSRIIRLSSARVMLPVKDDKKTVKMQRSHLDKEECH